MKNVFSKDLEAGKKYENIVLCMVQKKYPKAYIVDGYCKEWDIFVPELNFGIEVKLDKKSIDTGNIVIEIEFDGKPSALTTTKAKWWVIYDGLKYNWFCVKNIFRCIEENNLTYKKFVGRGDIKEKKAYLIKKKLLFKYKEYETWR
tara:strand:- start:139 stop:576 length:438 start_codon:yes stop_codon:yes gene_type:complete